MYHRFQIDSADDEKANPGDKLWLVMRHMGNDKNHQFQPGQGYKLDIGDTIKFGRVRYKVIMMHNDRDGQQEYHVSDRFKRQEFMNSIKLTREGSPSKPRKSRN